MKTTLIILSLLTLAVLSPAKETATGAGLAPTFKETATGGRYFKETATGGRFAKPIFKETATGG